MRFLLIFILLSPVMFVLNSCKQMPNDGIPFYMKIDTVSVAGATNHITDIWAEANATNLGAYELPCNFPVLEENQVRFVLSAGVQESGQSGVRDIYPFYAPDTFTLTATPTEKYSHACVFKYSAAAQFSFNENFEFGNSFYPGLSRTPSDTNNVLYGYCGTMSVSATDSNVVAEQAVAYPLPAGQEVWLEVDYKSDVPFNVGFYANSVSVPSIQVPVLFVTESAQWNKIYVKLSEQIAGYRADSYNIYFEALRPYGTNGGSLYLDNIRLVHF